MTRVSIDLSQLPFPGVVEPLSFEQIFSERKAALLAAYPDAADALELESDPLTKLLQENAYRELILRQRINDAAKSVMLAYARGSDLQHLAALFGVKKLPDEEDDRLRARVQLSPEGFSTAGPIMAYVFHALSASDQVADVYVHSPVPGEVEIVVLAVPSDENPNGAAGLALLEKVNKATNADDVRPLCDSASAVSADVLTYQVRATLILLDGPERSVTVGAAKAACQQYVSEQFRLGHDITISGLHAALHQPGVMRVDLASPTSTISVDSNQAALCTAIDISTGEV